MALWAACCGDGESSGEQEGPRHRLLRPARDDRVPGRARFCRGSALASPSLGDGRDEPPDYGGAMSTAEQGTRRNARWVTIGAALRVRCAGRDRPAAGPRGEPSWRCRGIALETASTIVALLAAYLVFGRFRIEPQRERSRARRRARADRVAHLLLRGLPRGRPGPGHHCVVGAGGLRDPQRGGVRGGRLRPDAPRRPEARRTSALLLGLPLVVGAVAIAEAAASPSCPLELGQVGRRATRSSPSARRHRPLRARGGRLHASARSRAATS